MNRFQKILPALVAFACALVAPAFAKEQPTLSASDNETPQLWFIEFAGAPLAEGGKKADLKANRDAFAAAARSANANYTKRFEFETLWNGISVSTSPRDLNRIASLPQVARVWPVDTYSLPDPVNENTPDLFTAIAMTGADNAHAAGFTGAGIKIGIIDTGVDIDHPDFGGTGTPGTTPFPNAKVVAGWDFVGNAYTGPSGPAPVPDPNPDDCGGHGSHVAGIAAANGFVTGVAPDAVIGAYRVFGCTGSTSADIMIAAMERAYLDGMNVVNMSIGSAFQSWPDYPTATAGDRLVARNVVVVCSIGNSGTAGLYANGAPGVGKDVIGTANFLNTHLNNIRVFTVSPDDLANGYLPATGSPLPPTSGTYAMARANLDGTPVAPGDMTGKVALVARGGGISFYAKAAAAQANGAVAVVIYNNVAGWINATVAGTPAITIPVVTVSDAEGIVLNNRLLSGPVDLTWTSQTGTFVDGAGGVVDSSSSYGVAADLSLKPDISAPGGNIFSTYPLENGGYATISGTSMASPHVAGTAALLRQARPSMHASAVRGILQNNALPKAWWGNPALGFLDNVHRQGAGMVQIDDAIAATTRVTPGKLSLGETEAGPVMNTLTIWNDSASDVTYDLSHTTALATGPNTHVPAFFLSPAQVSFSAPSVWVPAGGSASFDVTIDANAGLAAKSLFGGYLVATPQGDGEAVRVPFSGFKGDYQSIQVLVPTANNFPRLGWTPNGTQFGFAGEGDVFTLVGFDIPYVLMHLDHPSRRVLIEAFDATSGKAWHRVSDDEFVSRNSTATGFFAFSWDGSTFTGKGKNAKQLYDVPNGNYVLKVSVLKALGDPANPAHWETWTSPWFTIARP